MFNAITKYVLKKLIRCLGFFRRFNRLAGALDDYRDQIIRNELAQTAEQKKLIKSPRQRKKPESLLSPKTASLSALSPRRKKLYRDLEQDTELSEIKAEESAEVKDQSSTANLEQNEQSLTEIKKRIQEEQVRHERRRQERQLKRNQELQERAKKREAAEAKEREEQRLNEERKEHLRLADLQREEQRKQSEEKTKQKMGAIQHKLDESAKSKPLPSPRPAKQKSGTIASGQSEAKEELQCPSWLQKNSLAIQPLEKDAILRIKNQQLKRGEKPSLTFIKGGVPRNRLAGLVMPTDLDLVSDASEEDIRAAFPKAEGYELVAYQRTFGTLFIVIMPNGFTFQVTRSKALITAGGDDNHRLLVDATESCDFTLNAVYMNEQGRLWMPYAATAEDIENLYLRYIKPPHLALSAEPRLIFRALYFADKFKKPLPLDIERAIYSHAHLIQTMAHREQGEGLAKLFKGESSYSNYRQLVKFQVMQQLFPEFYPALFEDNDWLQEHLSFNGCDLAYSYMHLMVAALSSQVQEEKALGVGVDHTIQSNPLLKLCFDEFKKQHGEACFDKMKEGVVGKWIEERGFSITPKEAAHEELVIFIQNVVISVMENLWDDSHFSILLNQVVRADTKTKAIFDAYIATFGPQNYNQLVDATVQQCCEQRESARYITAGYAQYQQTLHHSCHSPAHSEHLGNEQKSSNVYVSQPF